MLNKYLDLIKNIGFSFLAYALPTAVLQFVVQPIVANKIGAEANGQYLTLISLNFFLIGVTATVLNTVRLLQNKKYTDSNISGDFNIILCIYAIIIIVVMPIGMIYYTGMIKPIDICLYIVIGLLYLYHDYVFAQYRLNLQYNKILVNNIILVVGYILGLMIFNHSMKWQFIFICSYALTFVYDYINTDFLKEPIKITKLFKETVSILLILTASNFLSESITYFDKLLLYPLLGGESVSIYNTASIVGKMLLMISAPLSSVFLSYLIHENKLKITLKMKHIMVLFFVLFSGYIICVIIGFPLVKFLYPEWARESHKLIPLTVAGSLFLLCGNCINTVLVRFFKMHLQIIIQSVHLVMYLFLSLIGLKIGGLYGFCIGVVISNCMRLLLVVYNIVKKPKNFMKDSGE